MTLKIKIVDNVLQKFPDLRVLVSEIKGVKVSELDPKLEEFASVYSSFVFFS